VHFAIFYFSSLSPIYRGRNDVLIEPPFSFTVMPARSERPSAFVRCSVISKRPSYGVRTALHAQRHALTTFPLVAAELSPIEPIKTFEPVLNVPALSVFLLVTAIFGFLQWRINAIGRAAEERTEALDKLREIKVKELSEPEKTDTAQVDAALKAYENAYWKVENLRTLLPGVRIIPPPSQSLNRKIMDENSAAAQQFLKIPIEDNTTSNARADNDTRRVSPGLIAILTVVAISQIALLVLFVATDPMLTTSGNGLVESTINSVTGLE
jgi:hypothetical protein